MKKYAYLVCESDSEIPFAVVKDVEANASHTNIDLINKVGQAVEDEFCYEERVKVVHNSIKENVYGQIVISFRGINDELDEEIRDIRLDLTTIY